MTPFQLYQWALKNIPSVTFVYCTTEEYEREKAFLEDRFQKSCTIAGTRSQHAFILKTTDTMTTKRFSFSTTSKDVKVMKESSELEMEDVHVSGYVICIHNNQWWLGCVLEKDLDDVQVHSVYFIHLVQVFQYPHTLEIITV